MKKILAVLMAVMMLAVCIPAAARPVEEPVKALPVGLDISAVNAPYLLAGGVPSTTDFLTSADFASHNLIVLNAWDHMCGPCTSEMPAFQRIHEEYASRGVLVVGVATTWIGGTYAGDYNYFTNSGYTYLDVRLDSVLNGAFSYHNFLPQTIFVSPEGIVVDEIAGGTEYATLKNKVDSWLSALQEDSYDVTFVDGLTNEVIEVQNLAPGSVPVYPEAPEHVGYTFHGWDPATPPVVMGPTTITATYLINTYRVRFYDNLTDPPTKLKTQYVQYGNAATAPTPPEHEGYVFVGWSVDFSFIDENLDVYTVYQSAAGVPGDADGNGVANSADALMILRYSMGNPDAIPAENLYLCDLDGNGVVNSVDALILLRAAMGL